MELKQILNKVNEDLKYYEVVFLQGTENVPIMCEDGEYRVRNGYAVYNKLSDTYEHTTTLLPGAIFQSQHLDATLHGLLNPSEVEYAALDQMPMDDVVAN
jgi:hypothetical protein